MIKNNKRKVQKCFYEELWCDCVIAMAVAKNKIRAIAIAFLRLKSGRTHMSYVNANEVLPDNLVQEIQKYLMDSFCIFQESRAILFHGEKRAASETKWQNETDRYRYVFIPERRSPN